ncbi:VirK family protein [Pelagibacterium halotolerans]|uniref:VirK family protein n=1 Tax=Pelagibacterium halotolerans TaxID=531813 RepID=UPI00385094CC
MPDANRYLRRFGLAVLCSISIVHTGHAEEHDAYRRVLEALKAGQDVTAVTDFNRCAIAEGGNSGPSILGGFHIAAFLVPGGQYIAFSNVHETLSPQARPTTEYLRYKVTPDGNALVTMDVMVGGAEHVRTETYECKLGDGLSFAW